MKFSHPYAHCSSVQETQATGVNDSVIFNHRRLERVDDSVETSSHVSRNIHPLKSPGTSTRNGSPKQ
jgi:hypothetical protein